MILTFDIVIFLVSYFYKLKGIFADLYMEVIKEDIPEEDRNKAKKLQEACRKTLILWVFSRQISELLILLEIPGKSRPSL